MVDLAGQVTAPIRTVEADAIVWVYIAALGGVDIAAAATTVPGGCLVAPPGAGPVTAGKEL